MLLEVCRKQPSDNRYQNALQHRKTPIRSPRRRGPRRRARVPWRFESDRKPDAIWEFFFVSVAYCDANVWRYFRQLRPRGGRRALASCRRSEDRASPRQRSRIFLQIGEDIMDDEMRREFSKLYDTVIRVGAKNDFGWISIAFTVNYVLLGIILWRLFG